jgi:hypothetical protein
VFSEVFYLCKSCCSESAEARREFLKASPEGISQHADLPVIFSQFGIEKALLQGNLLLFPKALSSVDGGSQPFDGRLGKLRYLGLALMVACIPIPFEIIQLCMSFPSSQPSLKDPFDFDEHLKESERARAPLVYPILGGHILTHTTGCLIAVVGRARAEEQSWDVDSVADECKHFVTLGLLARTSQYLLSQLTPSSNIYDWKKKIEPVIRNIMSQNTINDEGYGNEWFITCLALLHAFVAKPENQGTAKSPASDPSLSNVDMNISKSIIHAIETAKVHAVSFLRDISVIEQILIPNIFSGRHFEFELKDEPNTTLAAFMALFQIENISSAMESPLVKELLKSWFKEATESSPTHLDMPRAFPGITWPQTPVVYHSDEFDNDPSTLVPLLGCCDLSKQESESLCRISGLPSSYTDLYAELVNICPDCEQIALCLVCGEVSSLARVV